MPRQRLRSIAKTNLQASRASDTETLQSQVTKAAKKRLSLSGLEVLHGRSRCPKKNGSSVTPQNTDRLAGTRSAHRRLCRLFNLRGVATGSSRPDRRPRCRVSFGAAGRADGHAPLSPGAAAWIASAWTPPSSSPTSVSLIMRWRSSRLFPRNTSATIYTLK
jgi:hypothetical protein